jgi:hypothetical protein
VAMPMRFDPLVDLGGMWTTQFADRHLPLPELPDARYECIGGYDTVARAVGGRRLSADLPFPIDVEPRRSAALNTQNRSTTRRCPHVGSQRGTNR